MSYCKPCYGECRGHGLDASDAAELQAERDTLTVQLKVVRLHREQAEKERDALRVEVATMTNLYEQRTSTAYKLAEEYVGARAVVAMLVEALEAVDPMEDCESTRAALEAARKLGGGK